MAGVKVDGPGPHSYAQVSTLPRSTKLGVQCAHVHHLQPSLSGAKVRVQISKLHVQRANRSSPCQKSAENLETEISPVETGDLQQKGHLLSCWRIQESVKSTFFGCTFCIIVIQFVSCGFIWCVIESDSSGARTAQDAGSSCDPSVPATSTKKPRMKCQKELDEALPNSLSPSRQTWSPPADVNKMCSL